MVGVSLQSWIDTEGEREKDSYSQFAHLLAYSPMTVILMQGQEYGQMVPFSQSLP